MWSLVRSLLVAWSAASSVVVGLSFEATLHQDGHEVDASGLTFKPIPPRQHRRLGTFGSHRGSRRPRDKDISYSGNWCGASRHSTPADQITNVFGYFTAPNLTLRKGIPAPQFAAAWVGIDGAECRSALLQAGVTTIVNSNGGQSASAWWEWYPEAAYSISGLPVKAGDWMSVNVTASSLSSGSLVITNAQRGYSVTINLSNGPKLCRIDAEWILEDFDDADGKVAFANFSDLWFVDAVATTVRGKKVGINGSTMVHLQNENSTIVCAATPYDDANFVVTSHG